ncbi:MAG: hypothetical protein ACODAU_13380 [Myxococcota bacterium]
MERARVAGRNAFFVWVGGLALVGCGSSAAEPDLVLAERLTTTEGDADYDCLGTETAPGPEDPITFEVQFEDLFAGPVGERGMPGEVCFSFYPDNGLPASDSCTDSGMTATPSPTSDQFSTAEVTDPDGGWFALRSYPDDTNLGVIAKNAFSGPSGSAQVFASFKPSTADEVTQGFGHARDPDTAAFYGVVRDCSGRPVQGAETRVLLDGEVVLDSDASEGPFYGYFTDSAESEPDPSLENVRRVWFAGNIPMDAETATVVACGNVDGMPTVIGCEEIRMYSQSVHRITLGPVRADGPSCPNICE